MPKKERVAVESESEEQDASMDQSDDSGDLSQESGSSSQSNAPEEYGSSVEVPPKRIQLESSLSEGSYDDEESLE